ncbi:MAG: hypothetical protein HKN33_18385 [Pyrinomonadaceae bacterium]|nr:hypothetical protein [Pyrinomonadaceae bacterium]
MPFFTPTCPVDEKSKKWIEGSFGWLLEEFGEDAFRNAEIIRPDNKAFPELIFAKEESIREFLKAVCGFMDVKYETVVLEVFADQGKENFHPLATPDMEGSKACGLYYWYAGKNQIAIDQALLRNPTTMVATIAHELAHAKLRSDLVKDDKKDEEEFLTDLATVFFGMGIFTANSVFSFDQFTNAQFQGWRASRQGYIDEESAGYALALASYLKGENKPIYAKYLETNPKYYYKKALKYLSKTGDCSLKPIKD